jgi:hypothetical protein
MTRFLVKVVDFLYHILSAFMFRIGFGTFILACFSKRSQTISAQFCFRYKSGPLP